MRQCLAAASLVVAVTTASEAAAAAPTVRLTEAVSYASGKFGETQRTDVVVVLTAAKVSFGDWFVRGSAPYVSIRGPAGVVVDESKVTETPSARPQRQTNSGLGDVSLTLGRSFNRLGGSRAYVDVAGRVRLPTGSRARGLGVGATDFSLSSELGYAGRRSGAYLSAGRRFLGDVDGVNRRDGWQAGVGGWRSLGRAYLVGAGYDRRDGSRRGSPASSEIYGFASRGLGRRWRIAVDGGMGLSRGSPDYSLGLSVTSRLSWPGGR